MAATYQVGLIRVVTLEDQALLNLHGKMIETYYPQLRVMSQSIPDQPHGIHDAATEDLAIPKIIALAKEWKDIDALVISCAGDPAVKELQEMLEIPVIGAGESTALLAQRYGDVFGVLGLTREPPRAYLDALGDRIVGTGDVPGVVSTLDLMKEQGRANVIEKAHELKRLGAQVIALACTGMATIGISQELEEKTGIPVIDPVMAEGLITYFECMRKG